MLHANIVMNDHYCVIYQSIMTHS